MASEEQVHAGRDELFAKLAELGIQTNTKDHPEVSDIVKLNQVQWELFDMPPTAVKQLWRNFQLEITPVAFAAINSIN